MHENRVYKTVPQMIAGLRAGKIIAAIELADVMHRAVKNEKAAADLLTIIFALLPAKTRKKILSDPAVPSAKIIDLFPKDTHSS